MARVRIVKVPKALSGLEVKMQPGLYGTNGNNQFNKSAHLEAGKISQKPTEVRQTLEPVDREDANLEAEKSETAVINVSGMPAHFKIGGKRHSQGGTPLNLPDNSFIFSDTAKMKIKDPNILAQFGMKPKRGGYTPAEIAKKYDINKFRKVLADPNTEDIERKTAEMMIANYNEKLAKLALAQESVKGFPQGIPVIAMPYIENMEMNPATFLPDQAQEQLEEADSPDADMGTSRYGSQVISQWNTKKYGGLPTAQAGKIVVPRDNKVHYIDDLKRQATPSFSEAYEAKKKAEADKLKANQDAFLADLQDAKSDAEMNALYKQYAKVQERQQAGDIEANWWDYLPLVPNSAEQEMDTFKSMARAKGVNPYLLEKQITTGKNYNQDPRTVKQAAQVDPVTAKLKSAVETKVKNWLKPTSEEIDKLSDDELMYLNRIHKRYKVAGFSYGGSTSLPKAQDGKETAAELRKKYKEKATQEEGTATAAGEKKEEKKATTSSGKKSLEGDVKKTTISPTNPTSEYDPYGDYTEEELANLLEDPAILRKSKVAGKQSAGKEGTFGKGVSLEEFIKRNPEYIKKFEAETGEKFDPTKHSEKFQRDYNKHVEDLAYKRAMEAGYDEKEAKSLAKRFADTQGFYDGELKSGDPRGIDKKFGEYTSSRFEPVFKKKTKPADVQVTKTENKPAERGPIERHPPIDIPKKPYAPWWLQDIVKTAGAAADLARVKRYLPWQATPETRLPDATFYDPTRELAANAEQANIQTQGLAAFTGPQALSARSSQIQGQAMKNAADIMSRYNNMNVQIANQLSQERTGIMNQASLNKANLDTQLFDKYTIANQQFDNAKNMARQNLRQSYIDAITNRAKTQALNTLYPNFYTDPMSGGFVNKTGYASINPTKPGNDELDKIEDIIKRFPGTSFKDAREYLKGSKSSDNESEDNAGYLKAQGYT